MKVMLTGVAGFIGMHVAERLLNRGDSVVGLDNLDAYYEVSLKKARLERLKKYEKFSFEKLDVADRCDIAEFFKKTKPSHVIHLAAQAGVLYSFENPHAYADSNLTGFINVLEGCRHQNVAHLVYASSSSVYGGNTKFPSSEHDSVDHPVSLYAATKKANELMAHTYSHSFGLPTTGLRFFTVYGPWGRPDMAFFLFTRAILNNEPIKVFNFGNMKRDFTFVDDIVSGIVGVLEKPPTPNPDYDCAKNDPFSSAAPYRVFNIGNQNSVPLMDYIAEIEKNLGKTAQKELLPMPPGDVPQTYADTSLLKEYIGFQPNTPIAVGIQKFIQWYRNYYKV